jgi:hypothetical protein
VQRFVARCFDNLYLSQLTQAGQEAFRQERPLLVKVWVPGEQE